MASNVKRFKTISEKQLLTVSGGFLPGGCYVRRPASRSAPPSASRAGWDRREETRDPLESSIEPRTPTPEPSET